MTDNTTTDNTTTDNTTTELLDALKLAFSFMPTLPEIDKGYAEFEVSTREQVNKVRDVLAAHGIDPDKVYGRSGQVIEEGQG